MSRIVTEVDWPARRVDDVTVRIKEVVWSDGGRSFEVYRVDTDPETDLTEDGAFDALPTDAEIRALLQFKES